MAPPKISSGVCEKLLRNFYGFAAAGQRQTQLFLVLVTDWSQVLVTDWREVFASKRVRLLVAVGGRCLLKNRFAIFSGCRQPRASRSIFIEFKKPRTALKNQKSAGHFFETQN
ncbi:hypothetical protein LJC08_06050 [Methanimicrococcus sp. OttesenSCG-928-J09]|nr:hypothetical protein [Methanimicrococcus sp. OttesenSCG-928-J09]